jgi:heme exporter protein A
MHPPLRLAAEDLACARGERPVFSGLSFELTGGEALAVTGPNGAGKSTLLRCLAGLLPALEGRVTLDGAGDAPRRESVHYLGHLDALKPVLTVRETLAFWRKLHGGAGDLDEALEAVGLKELEDVPAGCLSAGQRRRVALARLLAAPRPVWLLDEPTSALDAAAQARLGELMAAHRAQGGLVVAATHAELPLADPRPLRLGP